MTVEPQLRRALRRGHLKGEEDAAKSAWPLVAAAHASGPRVSRRHSVVRGVLVPVALVAAIVVASLTPPGEAVARFVKRVVTTESPKPTPVSATSLPGGGRLLIAGRGGLFAVGGGRVPERFFGDADQATWSAHGRFVAATRGIELIAVSTKGNRHWSLHHDAPILDPRWDQGDGYRIVYRSGPRGGDLYEVNGDGTGDHRIDSAWPVAPAFRPHARHQVAYARADGSVVVVALDTGRVMTHTRTGLHPISLAWSPDGRRLLALSPQWLWVMSPDGRFLRRVHTPRATTNVSAAWAPRGNAYAVIRLAGRRSWRVVLTAGTTRTLFTLRHSLGNPLWSPDGRWLVVDALHQDQWLFLRRGPQGGLAAIRTISGVAKRFGGGKAASLQGWTASG